MCNTHCVLNNFFNLFGFDLWFNICCDYISVTTETITMMMFLFIICSQNEMEKNVFMTKLWQLFFPLIKRANVNVSYICAFYVEEKQMSNVIKLPVFMYVFFWKINNEIIWRPWDLLGVFCTRVFDLIFISCLFLRISL